jgi:hypothetical protein
MQRPIAAAPGPSRVPDRSVVLFRRRPWAAERTCERTRVAFAQSRAWCARSLACVPRACEQSASKAHD